MTYEILPVFIGNIEMGKLAEVLNAKCAEGWEPYAVDRSYHYFRREKEGSNILATIEERKKVAGKVEYTPTPTPKGIVKNFEKSVKNHNGKK